MIKAIFATDLQGGMGNKGSLPWPHDKEDLLNFKQITTGHIVVMGSNTWLDPMMPKPLPNRVNCVFSNKPIEQNLARRLSGDYEVQIKQIQTRFPRNDIFIMGGKELYEATNDLVERVYLTRMKGNYWCDTRINLERYLSCFRIKSVKPGENCTYEVWDRVLF